MLVVSHEVLTTNIPSTNTTYGYRNCGQNIFSQDKFSYCYPSSISFSRACKCSSASSPSKIHFQLLCISAFLPVYQWEWTKNGYGKYFLKLYEVIKNMLLSTCPKLNTQQHVYYNSQNSAPYKVILRKRHQTKESCPINLSLACKLA